MLHVGHYNYVDKSKILAITSIDSAPARRARQFAQDQNKLIDCSNGRKTENLIFLVDGFVAESSIKAKRLMQRGEGEE